MWNFVHYLAACGDDLLVTPDAATVDECAGACFTVTGSTGGRLLDGDDVLFDGRLPDDGRVCVDSLAVGARSLTWEDGDTTAVAAIDVRPFGWSYGLDRASRVAAPRLPVPESLDTPPILAGDPDRWDATSVMAPATIDWGDEELLFYAGTDVEHFALGLATRPLAGGTFEKYAGNPILWPGPPGATDGSWKNWAQNTPEPERVGDELWLYYNGQGVSDGRLSIGLAVGPDATSLVDIPGNPVLAGSGDPQDWDGRGVAHPSIVQRDGLFELWYASGTTFAIGYALSTDGTDFERYCHNPVFAGLGPETWDQGHVKAPEVWFDPAEETYFMSYSGCDKGCYQVGWAESSDGTLWNASPDPIVPAGQSAFASVATREAYVDVKDGTMSFVYTGNDGVGERIGRAVAPWPGQ